MIKKIIIIYALFLLTVALFVRCDGSHTSSANYMALEEIIYVDSFPQTFSLNNMIEIDLENIDIIGVKDFCIFDSLLIFSTTDKEGFWSFVSLPNYRFLGKFLTQGQGPYEFLFNPYVGSGAKFFEEKESIFAAIYDFYRGKLYKIDIGESIKNNRLNIYTINDSLPSLLFNFVMVDSNTFLCKEISNGETQQIRYMLVNGERITPPHLEKLNFAKIRKGENVNILSTITNYNYNKKLFVEMPVGLNYLNMYSMDSSFGKTICIGKQLDNIGKIQNKERWERIYTFADLRLFPKFWGVVYLNEDYKTNQIERKRLPNILLFDWNGRPLAKLNLNTFITSFDIDFTNGYLYTLDYQTDIFCKYDIREILGKL